ncbi:uncharacterized protein BDZ99DRAFT_155925 [Mytilinidion resinicola]|uniref:3'-5' exonuclease domain-containing protein n=1 Tax=Mytilinidion resinicola TaxID=574789 RepID=A0A6A6Y5X0_9PEZI|nr:uncharacterized protein BDZ99DRAFT_155925 [Mytilinidion resinicola]KAF2803923.1 hypothetical protein BDZ99DRAFT_155925 [Mytilinidion resinicola]
MIQTSNVRDQEASSKLVDFITQARIQGPQLIVDVQGTEYCIKAICVLIIFMPTKNHLATIFVDGPDILIRPGTDGTTIKGLLENPAIPKGFFDVRKASNAFYKHFGITLQGVMDIQLMECALRKNMYKDQSRRELFSLGDCAERGLSAVPPLPVTSDKIKQWKYTAIHASHKLEVKKGGSETVWSIWRPIFPLRTYTSTQVQILALLCEYYWKRMGDDEKKDVSLMSSKRVMESLELKREPREVERMLPWWDSGMVENEVAKVRAERQLTIN